MELEIKLVKKQLEKYVIVDIAKLILEFAEPSKLLRILFDLKTIVEKKYQNHDLKDFASFVVDELKKGTRDIAIHPEPIISYMVGEYVSVNDLRKFNIYPKKRKICYEIGELLSNCSTTKIRGRCGYYVGCKDERWGGGGTCMCGYGLPKNFSWYHEENNHWDNETFSVLPWSHAVGVRFYFKKEKKSYPLTEYFKTLGPFREYYHKVTK